MKRDDLKKILEYITKYGTYKIDHNKETNKLHNSILEIYNSQSIDNGVESNIEKILEIESTKYGIFKTISTDKTRGKNDARKMLLECKDNRFFALLTDFEYRLKKQVQTVIEIKRKYNEIEYCDLLDTLEDAMEDDTVKEILKTIETCGVKPREIKKREVLDTSNIESFIGDGSFTKIVPEIKEKTNQNCSSIEPDYPIFNNETSCTKNMIPKAKNDILEPQTSVCGDNHPSKIESPVKQSMDVCLPPKTDNNESNPNTQPNNTVSHHHINAEVIHNDERAPFSSNQLSPPEAGSSQNYENSEELNFVIGSIIEQSVKRDNMKEASLYEGNIKKHTETEGNIKKHTETEENIKKHTETEENIKKHTDTEENIPVDIEILRINNINNNIDLTKVNNIDTTPPKINIDTATKISNIDTTPPKINIDTTSTKINIENPGKRTKTSLDNVNTSKVQPPNKYNPYIANYKELKGVNIVEVPSKELEEKMKSQIINNFELSFEPPEIKENRVTNLIKDCYGPTVPNNYLCTDQITNDQENVNKQVLQHTISKTEIVKKNRIKERLTVSIPKAEEKIVNKQEADPASIIDFSEILRKSRTKRSNMK